MSEDCAVMDSSSPDAMVRQNLLERLLNSIKQVQVHFGAKQEIATENDARVSALCVEWEMVLAHGAKKPKPKNSLRLTGRTAGVSLWPLAKLCVNTEDLLRFTRLNHVNSELGRGRAWLRAAINERTLENYMHTVLSQEEHLRKLYELDAFLLDQERSSMLPVMAAGLSSIIFSIAIDASYLNTPTRSVEVPPPSEEMPVSQQVLVPSIHSPISSVVNTNDPELVHFPEPILLHNKESTGAEDEMIAVSAKVKKKGSKKSKSKSPRGIMEGVVDDPVVNVPDIPQEVDKLVPLKESASSSSSRISLNSVTEDGHAPMYVSLTTSHDLVSGEAMAAANATALVLSASSAPHPSAVTSADPSGNVFSADDEGSSVQPMEAGRFSPDSEMRSAMLALSKMKDELELQNRNLRETISEQQKALEKYSHEMEEMRTAHSGQKLSLERENDLLREQLKKYVSFVQSQHKEIGSNSSSSEAVSTTVAAVDEHSPRLTDQEELSHDKTIAVTEKKLQDMAEMYADLMELNERLHRSLVDKDSTISALVRSLREASIEIPHPHQVSANSVEPKVLVEVWIPSVIKKGRGPDGFHVYQVFVSVKGVEWNVYRRYTEFREFHRQLQKHVQEVSTFNFPPKKAIGNKSSQVVEERRQRLQEYLRYVIKCCSSKKSPSGKSQADTIITPSISKQMLVTIFPFFREDFNQDQSPTPQPSLYSGL